MEVSDGRETWLVGMANAGHDRALDELVERYLPLVYNIVGHGLGDPAEVAQALSRVMDRIQQEMKDLPDPAQVRAWVAASAVAQVRDWRPTPDRDPDEAAAPDFVATAIATLGLSGQARQLAEATRWLAPPDRDVLSLWWLTQTGELTRDEFEIALGLGPANTEERVGQLEAGLQTAREVVAALASAPACADLAMLASTVGERPNAERGAELSRHVRTCDRCAEPVARLAPAGQLLAGLGLVPPPDLSAYRALNTTLVDPGRLRDAAYVPPGRSERHGRPLPRWLLFSLAVVALIAAPYIVVELTVRPSPPAGLPVAIAPSPTTVSAASAPAPALSPSSSVVPTAPASRSSATQRSSPSATVVQPVAVNPPMDASYEAEAARLLGQAEVLSMPGASDGAVVHKLGTDPNVWGQSGALDFTAVVAPRAGRYAMTVFYISGEPRSAYVQVNGGPARVLSFPSGGNWDVVYSATFSIELTAGANSVVFSNPSYWTPRLDRVRFYG